MIHTITDPAVSAPITLTLQPLPLPTIVTLGAWTPPGDRPWDGSTAARYTRVFGTKPGLIHYYTDLTHLQAAFDAAKMSEIVAGDATPIVSWELDNYEDGAVQAAYSCAAIARGDHDAQLITWLQAAQAWCLAQPPGKRFFVLRPLWEMTGRWYPWAVQCNGNSCGAYIDAWRHLAILRSTFAPLVRLLWNPSVDIPTGNLAPLEDCYPGDRYVDYMGLDGYNKVKGNPGGVSWTFEQVFRASYARLVAMSKRPIIIGETGCNIGTDAAAWWAGVIKALDTMPQVVAIAAWNNVETGGLDCRLETEPAVLAAFRALAARMRMAGTLQ